MALIIQEVLNALKLGLARSIWPRSVSYVRLGSEGTWRHRKQTTFYDMLEHSPSLLYMVALLSLYCLDRVTALQGIHCAFLFIILYGSVDWYGFCHQHLRFNLRKTWLTIMKIMFLYDVREQWKWIFVKIRQGDCAICIPTSLISGIKYDKRSNSMK